MRKASQRIGLADQQQPGIGVGIEELAARRKRDAGAVITPMQSTAKVIMCDWQACCKAWKDRSNHQKKQKPALRKL